MSLASAVGMPSSISAALVFSSTIIGIKLLPTTVLHHRHLGELMIALLFSDLLAIIVLVMMESVGAEDSQARLSYLSL